MQLLRSLNRASWLKKDPARRTADERTCREARRSEITSRAGLARTSCFSSRVSSSPFVVKSFGIILWFMEFSNSGVNLGDEHQLFQSRQVLRNWNHPATTRLKSLGQFRWGLDTLRWLFQSIASGLLHLSLRSYYLPRSEKHKGLVRKSRLEIERGVDCGSDFLQTLSKLGASTVAAKFLKFIAKLGVFPGQVWIYPTQTSPLLASSILPRINLSTLSKLSAEAK